MAADLTQLEQGVQNGHLTLGHALLVHVGKDLLTQLAGKGGVQFRLFLLEGAVHDVFHLGGQILDHLGLGTPQDEGLDP